MYDLDKEIARRLEEHKRLKTQSDSDVLIKISDTLERQEELLNIIIDLLSEIKNK